MPVVHANGIDINYAESGEGFPLILLHGLSDDLNLWAMTVPALSGKFRTIAFDLRGHGHSSKPDAPYTMQLLAGDLYGLMEALQIERAHIMGLSMGAAIAQLFATFHPEKSDRLVLLSTFDHADRHLRERCAGLVQSLEAGDMAGFFDGAVKLVVSADFIAANQSAMAEAKKYCMAVNSPSALARVISGCMSFDGREYTKRITAPALLISGKEDRFTRAALAGEVHRAIPGSQWLVMDGVGHNLLVPDNLPRVLDAVMGFLR